MRVFNLSTGSPGRRDGMERGFVVIVRPAVIDDLDRLVPLFDGYRQFYGQPSDVAGARRFLRERFEHGQSILFLACDGDRAVGFTQLFPSFSSTRMARIFVLNDLFVLPEARGGGAARALLAAACDHGRKVGAVRLSLSTAVINTAAQSLYESAGWRRDTEFHGYAIALT